MSDPLRCYLAEVAELAGGLLCALTNHAGACALLSYRTRFWNPVAACYHWGMDVAFAAGRDGMRCGCHTPSRGVVTKMEQYETPHGTTVISRVSCV